MISILEDVQFRLKDIRKIKKVKKELPPLIRIIEQEFPFVKYEYCFIDLYIRPPRDNGIITLGYAEHVANKYYCNINCYSYNNANQLLETLAHEFTHLEQNHRGDLKIIIDKVKRSSTAIWKGSSNALNNSFSCDEHWDEYYNSPWEVEARDRAADIVKRHPQRKTLWQYFKRVLFGHF